MNDNKNIDRLFQEKFKDFEATPDPQVWLNIEAALKEKKRRVIPFWLQFSGIAAAFILGLFSLNMVFKSNPKIKNTIVLDSKTKSEKQDSISNEKENINIMSPIKNKQKLVITNDKTVRNHEKNTNISESQAITKQNKNQNNITVYKPKNNSQIKNASTSTNYSSKSDAVIVEKNQFEKANSSTTIVDSNIEKGNVTVKTDSEIVVNDTKKLDKTDPESKNELDNILKKKEEEKATVVLNTKNKWQIVPNVAAVYLNSNSGGSSIDPQFSENTKTADNNLSFGLGVNYAVSKKLTLRTGVNKLSLGYNTNNVVYSTSLLANNLENIAYSSNESIEIKNELSQVNNDKDIQNTNTGAINQKMGFYEVPLELSYALINKKFGVSLIGGISTLFLNQNKISLHSSSTDLTLGEANNLNAIHFSTNLGMGFNYQFVKSFQINVEPMVKYQLNTFTNNSSNYNPIFIGLYSGIIYSF